MDAPSVTDHPDQQHVAVLAIGDELVLGQTVDTNSAWLSERLARRGVSTLYHQTLADDFLAIADAFRMASERVDLVLITGGLGPTEDDLTRQALAEAMGVDLVTDEDQLLKIRAFFESRGRPMAERNAVQAMKPVGVDMITNDWGTAPGLKVKINRAMFYVMPGVPREMKSMFEHVIQPELDTAGLGGKRVILTTKLNTFGSGESNVADLLEGLMDRDRNPIVGTTVSQGVVSIRVRSEFPDAEKAESELQHTLDQVRGRLGALVYGSDDDTLQADLVRRLIEQRKTVATAESCTGGLIGKMLTDVAGSSSAFVGGFVTYANDMKIRQLGVPESVIASEGAVSEQVVVAMARGAVDRTGADFAVSVSGVAGPGGGSVEKPVGTVWIGLAWRDESEALLARGVKVTLPGSRASIRDRSAKCALQLLRLHLMGEPLERLDWAQTIGMPMESK